MEVSGVTPMCPEVMQVTDTGHPPGRGGRRRIALSCHTLRPFPLRPARLFVPRQPPRPTLYRRAPCVTRPVACLLSRGATLRFPFRTGSVESEGAETGRRINWGARMRCTMQRPHLVVRVEVQNVPRVWQVAEHGVELALEVLHDQGVIFQHQH